MALIKFLRYLFGYVTLLVYGDFPERILNLCVQKKVSVWDLKTTEKGMEICVSVSNFKRFRKIRGRSGIRCKIIGRHGLPFCISKYKLRWGLPVGLAIFFLVLKIMSLFVWNIDIVGNSIVSDKEILTVCAALNLQYGTLINSINEADLKDKMMLRIDGLAWAAINIEGCNVTINVTESKNQNVDFTPQNIIAGFDGVVKEIKAINGKKVVVKGDAVQKGDLLISGTVDVADKLNFTKAEGTVIAEVEQAFRVNEPFEQTEKIYTGLTKNKCVLEFFKTKIPLYLGSEHIKYDEELAVNNLVFFGEKMPILFYKKNMKFYTEERVVCSRDELIIKLENIFKEQLIDNDIKEYSVISREITETDGGLLLYVKIKFEKNIGIAEKISFNTLN